MAGVFITLEGIDGSGKSTIARRLTAKLEATNREVILCREPGGTALGEAVRELLLDRGPDPILARTEALLFAAARAQLVGQIIEPALERGAIVISDRFTDSSLAYQWGGRGLPREAVEDLQRFAAYGGQPDLKLLFDLPVETALRRRRAAGDEVNRLDAESIVFFSRVRDAYHALADEDGERWRVIDAAQSEDDVWRDTWRAVADSGLLEQDSR